MLLFSVDPVGSGWLKDAAFLPHPKSIVELRGSDEESKDSYENGRRIWDTAGDVTSEVDDALRFFAEDCDSLQVR